MPERKPNPYINKNKDGSISITKEGEDLLNKIVTDITGPVYAFSGASSPLLAAAAMARLSRRGSDLREIYLDEFAMAGDSEAEGLIDRVVTGYGDDSVQQLITVLTVVENASNLLTKKIEWSRLASYLEQSTRYIFYDQKDKKGEYKYFIPSDLPAELTERYKKDLDGIFELYSKIVRGVTEYVRKQNPEPADPTEKTAWLGATRAQACDAVRPTLPVATKSTVGIVCSAQAMESMVRRLLADPLKESNNTGRMLLRESRKVVGAFLKRADMPERGLAWVMYMKETEQKMKNMSQKYAPKASRDFSEMVRLISFYPENELDLVPEMLFKSSELSSQELIKEYEKMSLEQREEVFHAYMGNRLNRRHKPARALEAAHYKWEIVADYGTFRDLQRHRIVDEWEWQNLNVKYGYDVSQLVKDAGFENDFRKCFDISEQLFKTMSDAGLEEEAQYVTLLGHKMRYRFMINAREAFHMLELRTSPQGHPGYRKICQEMYLQLSNVHPRMGKAMKFINQGGDPPLTRLEAERATQLKLRLLDENVPGEDK